MIKKNSKGERISRKINNKKNSKKIADIKDINNDNNKKIKEKNKFKRIKKENIIDTIQLSKNFDFDKNNYIYLWEGENFQTTYTKKNEYGNLIYLVCSKRGYSSNICPGKAKYNKETGKLIIYEKCINNKNNHNLLDINLFRNHFKNNEYKNIDMNNKIFQKYYIQCLFEQKNIYSYIDCIQKFKTQFPNNTFILTEENIKKIKFTVQGGVNKYNIEDLCKSIKSYNNEINIDIYPIKTEYKNKKNEIENREQNIIIIGNKSMLKYLSKENAKQFGLDCTFRIIPRSLKPYKLMTIYAINPEKNNTILTCLICIKYTDSQSLIKLFSILKALYDLEPIFIITDFDKSQIYALKNCQLFIKKPFIICCFFHYVQCIIKHFKKFKIIKKKLNKNAYEILRNLEVLAFIDKKNIEIYFKFLKDQLIENDNDQLFFNYYENYWIKRNKNYFNYSDLVTDILKIKKKIYK